MEGTTLILAWPKRRRRSQPGNPGGMRLGNHTTLSLPFGGGMGRRCLPESKGVAGVQNYGMMASQRSLLPINRCGGGARAVE